MKLSHLLSGVPVEEVIPEADTPVSQRTDDGLWGRGDLTIAEVREDSRKVGKGDLFVAVPGQTVDGHRFLADAAAHGMAAAVVERPLLGLLVPQVRVASSARALALIAQNRHRRPADELLLCAVTGTNGKTTTNFLIESLLQSGGFEPGLIGTVLYRYRGRSLPAPWTTPAPLELHRVLREMRDAGVNAVAMEASSHALMQERLFGVRFRVCAFTNLTQDHLDFHGDMEAYYQAKRRLFQEHLLPAAEGGVAVIHIDGEYGRRLAAEALPGRVLTVSTRGPADISVIEAELTMAGIHARLRTPCGEVLVHSPLIGQYNLENLALAAGVGLGLGLPVEAISAGLQALGGVPGRVERVVRPAEAPVPAVFVDYAHTPDALARVIAALRPIIGSAPGANPNEARRPGRLIVVFGCGGDRDRDKRPKMGQVVARDADLIIVTSDNPRGENPQTIIDAIVDGVVQDGEPGYTAPRLLQRAELPSARRGYFVEPDRRLAIRTAIAAARPEDVALIAGKGHEDYQIIGGIRHHFDDREEAAEALRRGGEPAPQQPLDPAQVSRPSSGPGPGSLAAAIDLPLERVLAATSGTLLRGAPRRFTQVVIDGRAAGPGALFVAIRGVHNDGHAFAAQAVAGGAAGVMVERGRGADLPGLAPETVVIEVGDTTVALGQLARAHREAPEIARGLSVIAVTGSTGKTSTKDLIAAILEAHAPGLVLKTEGNLNNHWGVPLTLLRLRAGHRYAVIEMGMSARGEIAYLTALAQPDAGVITNVAPVHLLLLGTVANVAAAKGELFLGLGDEAVAVYPCGAEHGLVVTQAVFAGAGSGRLRAWPVAFAPAGVDPQPSVPGDDVARRPLLSGQLLAQGAAGLRMRLTLTRDPAGPGESFEVQVPLLGAHQGENAALAAALALALDVPPAKIEKGLATVQPAKHRGQVLDLGGRHVIDDCYNASPLAMRAALATLAALRGSGPGQAIVIFGDMLELGADEAALHEAVGAAAAGHRVDLLISVGQRAAWAARAAEQAGIPALALSTPEGAAAALAERSARGDWVLVKGSRGMQLERALSHFAELLGEDGPAGRPVEGQG